MRKLINIFCGKITIWLSLAIVMSFVIHTNHESFEHEVLKSDGRGYYAYLPALFIYQDASYEKVLKAEEQEFEGRTSQTHLFTDKNGNKVNKYFPGVSIMHAPFFVCAAVVCKIFNKPIDGYNSVFMLFLVIGSVFYTLLGIVFLYKSLIQYTQNEKVSFWVTGIIFFSTQLFFHALAHPSFSHNYSFFLFSLLLWVFQKFVKDWKWQQALLIGIVAGMIFLVRPTNILMLLFLPVLLKNKQNIISFFKRFFNLKNGYFAIILSSSLLVAMILPILWKWQTGNWLVWSYDGEGFDFSNPHIIETLFGYRMGIFLHTPLLIIGAIGVVWMFRKKLFSSYWWLVYFFILIYVTSSWWCWDYESYFGHRALSEHLMIFAFPLSHLLMIRNKKWIIAGITICFLYTSMRYYQLHTDIFDYQKFTSLTYWKSMGDLSTQEENKYFHLLHCKPLGNIVEKTELKYTNETNRLQSGEEFTPALIYHFPMDRFQNRFMFETQFDKKLLASETNWKDVYLVFDATNEQTGKRIYYASPIYEYYKEGTDYWHSTIIQNEIPVTFQPMEKVSVYFWNPQHKKIAIRNFELKVREIGN